MSYRVRAAIRGDNSWCIRQKAQIDHANPPNVTAEYEHGSGNGELTLTFTEIDAPNAWEAAERVAARSVESVVRDAVTLDLSCEIEEPR